MKFLHKFTAAILACAMLASCTTTQTIRVSGLAGTEIYTPSKTKVGTINNLGTAEITLDSDAYYAYLLSKAEGSDEYVPFALDYKNHSYAATKMALGAGYTITSIGLGATVIGTIALCAAAGMEDEDMTSLFGTVSGIGGLVTLAGVGIGMPADSRMSQLDHAYQFKYLPTQSTNQDFAFTQPNLKIVSQPVQEETKANVESKKATQETKDSSVSSKSLKSSTSTKKLNDKSTKSFKNHGATVEGSYIGTGSLSMGGQIIESYKDIAVKIVRVDDNTVTVNVTESNGVDFFNEPATYTIKKDANGNFTLTHDDIAKATIKIDRNKKAIYLHPRVNIDGDIYTLKITATLTK